MLSLENNLKIDQRQFSQRTATGRLEVFTLLKEAAARYNRENIDVHCAMVDMSEAYDRINNSSQCDELKATDLPGQIVS